MKICLSSLLLCLFLENAYPSGKQPVGERMVADTCQDALRYILFPNPAEEYIQIRIPERCFQPYLLKIYNVIGQLMHTWSVSDPVSQPLDISHWANGTYLVLLDFEDKTITKRFVKHKAGSVGPLNTPPEGQHPWFLINNNFN